MPGKTVAIGDVSQPGCGQVEHGVLVQLVRGRDATALVAAPGHDLDALAAVTIETARDFPWESDRFTAPTQRVRVARRVLAWSEDAGQLVLRVGRTRHAELSPPGDVELASFEAEVQRLAARGVLATRKKITTERGPATLSVWVDEGAGRQLVVVSDKPPRRRIDFADVHEVRLATWQDKKPGSRPDEIMWVRGAERAPAPPRAKSRPAAHFGWERWGLMYEAGHISHLSGIDADLSYVTVDNRAHFAVDLDAMDVAATFRWFELLEETARRLGTPVDGILVDGSIERHLKKNLPMKGKGSKARSRVWRLVSRVGGHDGHHHLRIVEASDRVEKAARKTLGLD
jgi:hypothetical protein